MALRDLSLRTEKVQIGDTEVEVHGLTLQDIAELLDHHKPALTAFFEAEEPSVDLLRQFSNSVGAIIARAASEPEAESQVQLIALGDQLKLISTIWTLTNLTADDLGKMVSGVLEGLRKFNEVKELQQPSTAGSQISRKPTNT
jgi:hypothetical protein